MTNSWPDDNSEYQASDIDKILDEELRNSKPILRPTDRKYNNLDPTKINTGTVKEVKPIPTLVAIFLAGIIAIAIVSLVLLILFGLLLQTFQWVVGMVR
jgi:hypothetical protein